MNHARNTSLLKEEGLCLNVKGVTEMFILATYARVTVRCRICSAIAPNATGLATYAQRMANSGIADPFTGECRLSRIDTRDDTRPVGRVWCGHVPDLRLYEPATAWPAAEISAVLIASEQISARCAPDVPRSQLALKRQTVNGRSAPRPPMREQLDPRDHVRDAAIVHVANSAGLPVDARYPAR